MSAISWMDDSYSAEEAAEDAVGGDFDALPAGDYEMEVIDVQEKPIDNAKATGTGVNVQFRVADGKHENRRHFEFFCVVYNSKLSDSSAKEKAATAQRIGRGKFGSLCVALGISKRPGSYDELIGKHTLVSLGKKKDSYNGEEKDVNYVKTYKESAKFTNASRPQANTNASPWG